MRLVAWWNGLGRQKRVGWLIIIVSTGYILYFVKARLFADGPEITRKEWVSFLLMFVCVMLGTINVRMAEMRERNRSLAPPTAGPKRASKK